MTEQAEHQVEAFVVWNHENRPRYDQRGQRYPSDLANDEWILLNPRLPTAEGVGRPRRHSLRQIMNGIRYVQGYGIPWDAMPKDLPPGSICYAIPPQELHKAHRDVA